MAENHFINTKIFCMSLLCEQGLWFSIICSTTSLSSKHKQKKLVCELTT